MKPFLLLTCEHASRAVPRAYRALFSSSSARAALQSHRAWDPGALPCAQHLAQAYQAPLFLGEVTRLLVDLNRSPSHPRVFSEWSQVLPAEDKQRLLERYHVSHFERVLALLREQSPERPLLHIAVHSFTPLWEGELRPTDVGLLYDPARSLESTWAHHWQRALRQTSSLCIHRNAPYRGTADGLPTRLRRLFADPLYAGIELELNQSLLTTPRARMRLCQLLELTLSSSLQQSSLS